MVGNCISVHGLFIIGVVLAINQHLQNIRLVATALLALLNHVITEGQILHETRLWRQKLQFTFALVLKGSV